MYSGAVGRVGRENGVFKHSRARQLQLKFPVRKMPSMGGL